MGANAQTSVPKFTAAQVLTASQQNLSAATGVPVFATTTTRDAAFGGSNKALAEGQLCYIEASDVVQYYTGSAWATVGPATAGGLVLVKTQTIGSAVGSVAVADAFSATYNSYKIMMNGGVGSANTNIDMILTGSTSGYINKFIYGTGANNTVSGIGNNAGTKWQYIASASANSTSMNMDIYNPFLAAQTQFNCFVADTIYDATSSYGMNGGAHSASTSYTGFTLTPQSGTLTGGTIRVYGYANS